MILVNNSNSALSISTKLGTNDRLVVPRKPTEFRVRTSNVKVTVTKNRFQKYDFGQ